MSEAAHEALEQRAEAFRFVHENGVAGVVNDFHARTANMLLHVRTDTDEGTLRRRDDQRGLIDSCQGGPVVGGEEPGPNRDR